MKKFKKKPVEISAWQFNKENYKKGAPNEIRYAKNITLFSQYGGSVIGGEIETLEGVMNVSEDDWIIRGVQGEFYPCKPDIFAATYEAVETEK